MADSVVEIFNSDITNDQMVSGYDVVTTDANTTYVIKDVRSLGGYYLTAPAKINNTLIGDFSSSLAGSEIMGVNSTLNVTGAAYEYSNLSVSIYNQSADKYQSTRNGTINAIDALSEQTDTSATLPSNVTYDVNSFKPTLKFGDSYYQFISDGNSTSQVYYWPTGTSSRVSLQTTAYRPMAYSIKNQEVYYVKSNQGLYRHSPTGGESSIRASLGTFSSYPRATFCNDWFFYIPNNGETTTIYCINVNTGVKVSFGGFYASNISTNFQLAVSYDEASDKFYMYRRDNSWNSVSYNIGQHIPSVTKTQMDALTSDINYNDSSTTTRNTSIVNNLFGSVYSSSSFGAATFYGSQTNGTDLYFMRASTGSNPITVYKWDFQEMAIEKVYESTYTYGAALSQLAALEHYVPSSTEISSTNYDPSPNVRLRLTGVKTTTA